MVTHSTTASSSVISFYFFSNTGSWGGKVSYLQNFKNLNLGSWGALLDFDFLSWFWLLGGGGRGRGETPRTPLNISILLFHFLAKNDFWLTFSFFTASISGYILAAHRKYF